MKLSRNSSALKWIYWPAPPPSRTSLCKLFWLTVFGCTLKPLVMGLTFPLGFPLYKLIIWQEARREKREENAAYRYEKGEITYEEYRKLACPDSFIVTVVTIIGKGLKVMKDKFCPIIFLG